MRWPCRECPRGQAVLGGHQQRPNNAANRKQHDAEETEARRLPEADTSDAVDEIGLLDTLQGIVINEIETLSVGARSVLACSYLNVDFDSCYIFEYERKPSAPGTIPIFYAACAPSLLLGDMWGWIA